MSRTTWALRIWTAVAFAWLVRWEYGGWGPKQWAVYVVCMGFYALGIWVKAQEQKRTRR